jgi:sensor histidine kinase regulating citrate/malate metabolism
LSESRLPAEALAKAGMMGITRMTRRKKMINKKMKSVRSENQCQFVVQTINDIVKAYGGQIIIESKENEGSRFSILLDVQG